MFSGKWDVSNISFLSFQVLFPLPWFMIMGERVRSKKNHVLLAGPLQKIIWRYLTPLRLSWGFKLDTAGLPGFAKETRFAKPWQIRGFFGIRGPEAESVTFDARFVDGLGQHLYVLSLHRSWWGASGLRVLCLFYESMSKTWCLENAPWRRWYSPKTKIFSENWWLEADSFPFGDIR